MHMNKFLIFIGILLAGCTASQSLKQVETATANPTDVQDAYLYSTSLYGGDDAGPAANIAVLLPMSGPSKSVGNDIKLSLETAFLRKPKKNITVSFYDLSGDKDVRDDIIRTALQEKPDVIIGPLFAEDTETLRDMKPSKTPVISFTSDINALGDNVVTTNLIPTQSIETIIRQMQDDGATKIIIFAPNDKSGQLMTSVADKAASLYRLPVNGIFYYDSEDSNSIKDASMRASMYKTRNAANTRAREILSDILTKETIDSQTRANLNNQLEKISRTDTLGQLPYDAILFLGTGEDAKTIASFLRYYGVGNRDAAFYGTTLWHNSNVASDFILSGAKYATLPEISDNFKSLYNMMSGKESDYLSAFGYDAANLALGIIYTQKPKNAYLFDPSGYIGTTGIFRLQPSGESERGLRIMELNGSENITVVKNAPTNFIVPLYNINTKNLRTVSERELSTRGVNPGDYITIPESLRRKSEYKTKTIGANYTGPDEDNSEMLTAPVQVYANQESETISNPEFEPVKIENVSRKYIDSVEIEE